MCIHKASAVDVNPMSTDKMGQAAHLGVGLRFRRCAVLCTVLLTTALLDLLRLLRVLYTRANNSKYMRTVYRSNVLYAPKQTNIKPQTPSVISLYCALTAQRFLLQVLHQKEKVRGFSAAHNEMLAWRRHLQPLFELGLSLGVLRL